MTQNRVVWSTKDRHTKLGSDELLSIGLNVIYPDRECDIHIVLSQPIDGRTPENTVVLDEFRRLHSALGHILAEQRS